MFEQLQERQLTAGIVVDLSIMIGQQPSIDCRAEFAPLQDFSAELIQSRSDCGNGEVHYNGSMGYSQAFIEGKPVVLDAYRAPFLPNHYLDGSRFGYENTFVDVKVYGEVYFAGDCDLDGDVDFQDFLHLSTNFGATDAAWADGDFDVDGDVDFADFLALSAAFEV